VFTSCAIAQKPADRIDQIAAEGQIDRNAPVKTSTEIDVQAPPDKAWRVLTDIDNWPKWQPAVSAAKIDGPLQTGTNFTWTPEARR